VYTLDEEYDYFHGKIYKEDLEEGLKLATDYKEEEKPAYSKISVSLR
jgi:hypothetical protein